MQPDRPQSDAHSRSRSPRSRSYARHSTRHRSRSPRHHAHYSDGHRAPKQPIGRSNLPTSNVKSRIPVALPFSRSPLSKYDLKNYKHLFASYLDIQKQIDLHELPEAEVKGRWKSFIGKWNRGELAQGWYDPETFDKAVSAAAAAVEESLSEHFSDSPLHQSSKDATRDQQTAPKHNSDGSGEDDYGPTLPHDAQQLASKSKAGPTIPKTSDLALRDDLDVDDRIAEHRNLQMERKAHRTHERERAEELSPRAEPGTRERQLEKRRELAASNRAFAEARGKGGGGGLAELEDKELIGGEGGVEEIKRMRQHQERRKNEREVRREEMLRARAAEREERLAGLKEKEEQTMSVLKAIAKERFG